MTRFVTQQEPLISLSDHRASSHVREHEDQARRTQLRKPITSVPLTGTGACYNQFVDSEQDSDSAVGPIIWGKKTRFDSLLPGLQIHAI